MSTRAEVIHLVSEIQYLPNSPITNATIRGVMDMFIDDLEDLPVELVTAAFRQYRSTAIFFPTPGSIREIAMDLQMIAMGVPTPTEAWGMVLTAEKNISAVWCEVGGALRDTMYDGSWDKYRRHMDECLICRPGGTKDVYNHAVVEETVRMLGGRDIIITDNPTADRVRFIDAYREIVARERKKVAMLPTVRSYIEDRQQRMIETQIKQLAGGLKK